MDRRKLEPRDANLHSQHPEEEADILNNQVILPDKKPGFLDLYRYSSRSDLIILVIATLSSIIVGAALPLMTVIFGNLQGSLQAHFYHNLSREHFDSSIVSLVLDFVYLALGAFVGVYISTIGFIYTGENISSKIRQNYLRSCIYQNPGFFDQGLAAGEFTNQLTNNINLIQEGISEKFGLTISAIATFISAFVIGFFYYWKLASILTSTIVIFFLIMGVMSAFFIKYSKRMIQSSNEANNLVNEVISSIRNTVCFGTQERLSKQYDSHLSKAEQHGWKAKASIGLMVAMITSLTYLNYGLAFWQGSKFLMEDGIPLSHVLIIVMSFLVGILHIGTVPPNLESLAAAISAAHKVYNTIDRVSSLDSSSKDGTQIDEMQGSLRLENLCHAYPARPGITVLCNVNLTIPAGKVTAIVGLSGSGKSTIISLIERFYIPVSGIIYLDGHDISKLNLRWLRQQIGFVSQEPTLLSTTIYENICYGLMGEKYEGINAKDQQKLVETAAKQANAHDFITAFPDGYMTQVGARGCSLSVGQKQRIAIARAIVSQPKILLLDEATSALDTESERQVQAALDAATRGRTTVMIAHRLSTIKGADNIVVMDQGRIVEQGTHDTLLAKDGVYAKLTEAQQLSLGDYEEKSGIITRNTSSHGYLDQNISRTESHTSTTAKVNVSKTMVLPASERETSNAEYDLWTLLKLVTTFNKGELRLMGVGIVLSAICGCCHTTQAVLFAEQIRTLIMPLNDKNRVAIKKESDFWSAMFLLLAFVQLAVSGTQGVIFAKCSERLVHRARFRVFRSLLRQDISFFDEESNSAGALSAFLSTQTTELAGLSGNVLGALLNVITILVSSIALSLAIGWKLALVCMATIPVLVGCGYFRFRMLAHYRLRHKKTFAESASYAEEAVSAIRTVASLTREEDVINRFKASLTKELRASLISILKSTVLFASSQSFTYLAFALGFWYGGTLITTHEYTLFQFFVCFSAIMFGAQACGNMFFFAPDMAKAHDAAVALKALFDRQPAVDTWSNEGIKLASIRGSVEFRDVEFEYPTRHGQPVLCGLNLAIQPGQYVAFVGSSGCGKSTSIGLLERFYDATSGTILIDGNDIRDLNVNDYRSFLSLVTQEPTLYQGTIRENIALGATSDEVTEDDVYSACQEAGLEDFIATLPDGLNTFVGSKGVMLSGGQKQRIAIARALIRNPRLLLLDEATSALDSESESLVQDAFYKAAKNRTTIAVAHRLSTIQNADIIYVFDQGRVVEKGTHAELMKQGGRYSRLVKLQEL
ncbi:ABC transporter [Colletotrichum sublineola]|nr:ABC transporter [Colletotrichum sublineola]